MTCDVVRDGIDRYLSGGLDPADQNALELHVAGCTDCRADVEASRFLAQRTAGLRREITPATDLWTGIAPRLGRQVRRLSLPVWWVAAAAVLLVAATSALTVALVRRPQPESVAGFASTEARYQQAALEVAGLYQQARDSLRPETRLVLERNLAVIERALGEARDALRTDPANRAIEVMVVAAYQRKIAFLERAASLDRGS